MAWRFGWEPRPEWVAVLLLPFLRELARASSGTQGGAAAGPVHMFQLSVRKMIDSGLVTGLPIVARWNGSHPVLFDQAVRLGLLLPGYALEFGAYGLVLLLVLRERKSLNRARRTALALILGGMFLLSFLRSSVIGNNDFGYRAALIPSFLLLLLTAERLTLARPGKLMGGMLLVGAAGTAFQAVALRIYVPLRVRAGAPGFVGLPETAFAARTGYAEAAKLTAADAVVQSDPVDPANYGYVVNMLYSERAMATDAAVDCGAVFGGDPGLCRPLQQAVRGLYRSPAPTAAEAIALCRRVGVEYLAIGPGDAAWHDRAGWAWTLPVISSVGDGDTSGQATGAAGLRVVDCRGKGSAMP